MFSKYFLFLLCFIFLFTGCKKDEVDLAAEPEISVVSVTPTNPTQYVDPVMIRIHYEDGDGDLGENDDNVKNCFVTDNRVNITYEFRIQQLSPSGSNAAIAGDVNIDLGGQALTDSSAQQNVTFTVRVVDRAGHQSNSVTTDPIVISR